MPLTLDPQQMIGSPSNRLILALFEGLVNIDAYSMTPQPGVASHWHISDDNLVYTFYIRNDARWSDNTPITAEDFLWSWQRLLNAEHDTPYASMLFVIKNARDYANGKLRSFDEVGVKALTPHTLRVTLENPTPYFLQLLANVSTFPVPRQAIEKHGEAGELFTGWTDSKNLISNGPFNFESYSPDTGITVSKNPTYWDQQNVNLNSIVFYVLHDNNTEEAMFNRGDLHYTQSVPLNRIEHYQNTRDPRYRQTRFLATYFYIINTRTPPLNDVRVRRALSLAIDRSWLNEVAQRNALQPAHSFTPPGIQDYYPRELATYNADTARTLLAEAGYPNGENWPRITLSYNPSDVNSATAEAVVNIWKKNLNINIALKEYNWDEYALNLGNQEYDIARMTWIGDYLDPKSFLELFLGHTKYNPSDFSNPHYDELILKHAPAAKTQEERNAIYTEAETILMEFAPLIPLFTHTSKHLIHPDVRNMPPNILDFTNFKYVSLTPPVKN